jgi:hypothetical protein
VAASRADERKQVPHERPADSRAHPRGQDPEVLQRANVAGAGARIVARDRASGSPAWARSWWASVSPIKLRGEGRREPSSQVGRESTRVGQRAREPGCHASPWPVGSVIELCAGWTPTQRPEGTPALSTGPPRGGAAEVWSALTRPKPKTAERHGHRTPSTLEAVWRSPGRPPPCGPSPDPPRREPGLPFGFLTHWIADPVRGLAGVGLDEVKSDRLPASGSFTSDTGKEANGGRPN